MEVKGVRIEVLGRGSYGVVHLVQTMAPVPQFYAVKSADEAMSSSLRKEQQILQQFIGCPTLFVALELSPAFNEIKERFSTSFLNMLQVVVCWI